MSKRKLCGFFAYGSKWQNPCHFDFFIGEVFINLKYALKSLDFLLRLRLASRLVATPKKWQMFELFSLWLCFASGLGCLFAKAQNDRVLVILSDSEVSIKLKCILKILWIFHFLVKAQYDKNFVILSLWQSISNLKKRFFAFLQRLKMTAWIFALC